MRDRRTSATLAHDRPTRRPLSSARPPILACPHNVSSSLTRRPAVIRARAAGEAEVVGGPLSLRKVGTGKQHAEVDVSHGTTINGPTKHSSHRRSSTASSISESPSSADSSRVRDWRHNGRSPHFDPLVPLAAPRETSADPPRPEIFPDTARLEPPQNLPLRSRRWFAAHVAGYACAIPRPFARRMVSPRPNIPNRSRTNRRGNGQLCVAGLSHCPRPRSSEEFGVVYSDAAAESTGSRPGHQGGDPGAISRHRAPHAQNAPALERIGRPSRWPSTRAERFGRTILTLAMEYLPLTSTWPTCWSAVGLGSMPIAFSALALSPFSTPLEAVHERGLTHRDSATRRTSSVAGSIRQTHRIPGCHRARLTAPNTGAHGRRSRRGNARVHGARALGRGNRAWTRAPISTR